MHFHQCFRNIFETPLVFCQSVTRRARDSCLVTWHVPSRNQTQSPRTDLCHHHRHSEDSVTEISVFWERRFWVGKSGRLSSFCLVSRPFLSHGFSWLSLALSCYPGMASGCVLIFYWPLFRVTQFLSRLSTLLENRKCKAYKRFIEISYP